ncbi:MAG TPA: sigma-70 family RNA polymerase sigma factor, partial [Verrucomicrobiales bacterium]|nr:sigma-70 family RNA polymerase sigma factor [Verrucomicrobiales bacterium]
MESVESIVLLHRYAETGCEEAFRTLMRRYVDLIYSAALRRLEGDAAAAEDVVQRVFAELAAQAGSLKTGSRLGGWLYRCAVRFAADIHKAALRRRKRERKAADLAPLTTPEPDAWEEVAPRLDDAMQHLPATDRDALLLRFFEDRPLRAVGDALGLSEDAAQKRVSRALSRLRVLLLKRGVAVTVAGLTAGLTAHSVTAAPAGLAGAIPCAVPPAAGFLSTLQSIMNTKPILAGAAVLAAVAIPFYFVTRPAGSGEGQGNRITATGSPGASHVPAGPAPAGKSGGTTRDLSAPGKNAPAGSGAKDPAVEAKAEALVKARARAEEVTLKRYEEKMERLTRKLKLTPEQAEKIAAFHTEQRTKWVEYLTGATVGKADAQYYSLETGYREDIPPALQTLLSEEQMKQYREHDTNKRTNHIESVTSGEINYLAQRLDLDPQRKDALFQKLAEINRTDLFEDLTGVNNLAGIAKQADFDLQRRRTAFAPVLDEAQMKLWEEVVQGYRKELLHRFGQRDAATAEAGKG